LAGDIDALQSNLRSADTTRQDTATGWHRTFGLIALALVFVIAIFWQRSLVKRSTWHGNIQQQILDSLISPVFLIDPDAAEPVKNKAATDKKLSVIDSYIKMLNNQKSSVNTERVGRSNEQVDRRAPTPGRNGAGFHGCNFPEVGNGAVAGDQPICCSRTERNEWHPVGSRFVAKRGGTIGKPDQ
jgi:hypothetical protein